MPNPLAQWRKDPCSFISEVLINPETDTPFELFPSEAEFLTRAFTLTRDGKLPYAEMMYGSPKKSGKTCVAAFAALYVALVVGGKNAEVYLLSNDYEQSIGRSFAQCVKILKASPLLRGAAKITVDQILFPSSGSFILACPSDFKSFAGANPSLTVLDELWGFVTESSQRLFDESIPSPARRVSGRLVVTHAGFQGESNLLEGHYHRGLKGVEISESLYAQKGYLMRWAHHYNGIPWISETFLDEMRQATRPSAFTRQYLNEFTAGETGFVDMQDYDLCTNRALSPQAADERLPCWAGFDASTKRDSTACAIVTYDYKIKKVILVDHRIWTPTKDQPIDFAKLEDYLLSLRSRFAVRVVGFDPAQFVSTAQRLTTLGLPMEEFQQTLPNLEAAASNLFDLFRYQQIQLYPDRDVRLAMSRTVAIENPRSGRVHIGKSRQSHKVDIIAALSFACFFAVREGTFEWKMEWTPASAAAGLPSSSSTFDPSGAEPNSMYCKGEDYAAWEDFQTERASVRRQAYTGRYRGMFDMWR